MLYIYICVCVCVCVCLSSCRFWFVWSSQGHQSLLSLLPVGVERFWKGRTRPAASYSRWMHTHKRTHSHIPSSGAPRDWPQPHKSAAFTPLKDKEDHAELFAHIFSPLVMAMFTFVYLLLLIYRQSQHNITWIFASRPNPAPLPQTSLKVWRAKKLHSDSFLLCVLLLWIKNDWSHLGVKRKSCVGNLLLNRSF